MVHIKVKTTKNKNIIVHVDNVVEVFPLDEKTSMLVIDVEAKDKNNAKTFVPINHTVEEIYTMIKDIDNDSKVLFGNV